MQHTYLIVAFLGKIIVCDVYTLKHLFKLSTGDERAIFDVLVRSDPEAKRDDIVFAHLEEEKSQVAVTTCKRFADHL